MTPTSSRQRLLARIRRRFALVTDDVAFGPVRLAFTRVADPNRVLDEVAAEEDRRERTTGLRHAEPLHLPYWAELWDSGGGVATYLATRCPVDLTGRSVLDLGCGQGLLGCVAVALGARVLFADLESAALLFARLNALPMEQWTFSPRQIRTRKLDWQRDQLGERFDLIVGADILYDKTQWPHLERFWRAHLAEGGRVLLGEPGRPTGGMFLGWLRGKGWALDEHEQAVPSRAQPIRIFQLRRS
jgi:predicted nicotinamide N-methyase